MDKFECYIHFSEVKAMLNQDNVTAALKSMKRYKKCIQSADRSHLGFLNKCQQ